VKKYLIIGNGVAGTTAAEQIRKSDSKGDITILTDEDLPFYHRIRLNDYISGEISEQELIARKKTWYDERNIQLIIGSLVTSVDFENKIVFTVFREPFHYDILLLATGSHSFVPSISGTEKNNVFTLRSVKDARDIIASCATTEMVLLIGGGLLGLETGHALLKRNKQVTVVEFFPRLLPRQLDTNGAQRLRKIMEGMGFSFHLGVTTKEIGGTDSVEFVSLDNGLKIPSDMVIISAGVRPNLELPKQIGLKCDKGVVIDSSMRTSRPGIFAAGDVVEHLGTVYGSWPAAMQQGKVAGTVMAGGKMEYKGTVMANKLKVAGIDLASAGEIDVDNAYQVKVEETENVYKKLVFVDNRLIGCIMLGDTSDFARATKAIAEKSEDYL